MHTEVRIWKKVFAGTMIIVYLGGIATPSMVYFIHDVYHVMTHTVYQHFLHQYQHFKGIAHDHSALAHSHGHTHNGLIDFALHQINANKNRQPDRDAPKTLTTFKYSEHVKGNSISLKPGYVVMSLFVIRNIIAWDLSDPEPFTPPPKVL